MILIEKDQVHGYHRAEKGDGAQKNGMTEKPEKLKERKDDAGQDDIADELPFFLSGKGRAEDTQEKRQIQCRPKDGTDIPIGRADDLSRLHPGEEAEKDIQQNGKPINTDTDEYRIIQRVPLFCLRFHAAHINPQKRPIQCAKHIRQGVQNMEER